MATPIGDIVLILKGNINGWDFPTGDLPPQSRQDQLNQDNIIAFKNFPPKVLIINAHGSIGGIEVHKNGYWQTIPYKDFFSGFKKDGPPVVVFLFDCYAGSACKQEIVEQLPKGSLIGFFAPRMDIGRQEVSAHIISEMMKIYKGYEFQKWLYADIPHGEILFKMMPCCESFIAYNHPIHGFKEIGFPSYTNIAKADDVRDRIIKNLEAYNLFLKEINFQRLSDYSINPSDGWYKDLWFMQMVVELAVGYRSPIIDLEHQDQAIAYLERVQPDLLLHRMKLAGIDNDLDGYFNTHGDRIGPRLTPIFNRAKQPQHQASSSSQSSSSSSFSGAIGATPQASSNPFAFQPPPSSSQDDRESCGESQTKSPSPN